MIFFFISEFWKVEGSVGGFARHLDRTNPFIFSSSNIRFCFLWQTRQFHDKSRQQSKANNIEKSSVAEPENNLMEMNKCKCSKDTAKKLIKGSGSGVGVGTGAALVMPFHSHHPLMMGYKPLLSSLDLTANPAASIKPTNTCASSSCSSSRSASPSSTGGSDGYLPTLPVRTDSLTNLEEEALLKCAPWFQAGIPR